MSQEDGDASASPRNVSSTVNEHDNTTASAPSATPNAALQQIQQLLRAKDDTSRFVGLALLKSVLDNQSILRTDLNLITDLWNSISSKFLDRLLRAGQARNTSKDEATNMITIAVTVIHTFTILLPEEGRRDDKCIHRVPALVDALQYSIADTTILILQTLYTICSTAKGANSLVTMQDPSSLIELASAQPMALDIYRAAFVACNQTDVVDIISSIMTRLVISFRGTDSVTLLQFIAELIPQLTSEALSLSPDWLAPLIEIVKRLVTSRPNSTSRSAYTKASAVLLQTFPAAPSLLFQNAAQSGKESKPFSYLFINLILIDLRSSFPSLLAKLNSDDYEATSKRLACAFDIVSSFIGFLVRSMDNDEFSSNLMPPDLLLKLRKDVAETMSLTIEYIRDRWDSSVAGVAGLHPSAREGTSVTSAGTRLTLTWESMKDNVSADILILAAIRTLSIWLREDENENLRKESSGLMDVFVELYSKDDTSLDYKMPILMALEGIMVSEESVETFLAQDGWRILASDLTKIAAQSQLHNAVLGVGIVRVLLGVIDAESTSQPREEWMEIVALAASLKATKSRQSDIIELQIAVLQLAVALLELASTGTQKRYFTRFSGVIGVAKQLSAHIDVSLPPTFAAPFHESLEDVILAMENLR